MPSQTLDDQLFMKRNKAYLTTEAAEKEGGKQGEGLDRWYIHHSSAEL